MKRGGKHGDEWIFESGRSRYAHTERLGIQHEPQFGGWGISYGSDGGFWNESEKGWNTEYPLSKEDLLEVAEHQLEMWQKFKQWLADQASESER